MQAATARGVLVVLGSTLLLLNAGCGNRQTRGDPVGVSRAEATLLYWHLDPDSPAQPDQIADAIRSQAPDIAVLELEIGTSALVDTLQQALPEWGQQERLSDGQAALLLLSAYPILSRQSRSDLTYRMGGEEMHVRYGILDATVQLPSGSPVHILAVSVKDKTFHPAGQSEMRRNELRLITQHVGRRLDISPQVDLVLMGGLNDTPDAAALRGLIGGTSPLLHDLRPLDPSGDAWTSHQRDSDQYLRDHYLVVRTPSSTSGRILNHPSLRSLSRHRPLWLELKQSP